MRSYSGSRVVLMPRGKPSPKMAITVDADVHEKVIEAATQDGVSVSAWMTGAARRALLIRDGLAAVAEWEAEHGALTEAELAKAQKRVAAEVALSGNKDELVRSVFHDYMGRLDAILADGVAAGVFRPVDNTRFSLDIAVQKARTAVVYSDSVATPALGEPLVRMTKVPFWPTVKAVVSPPRKAGGTDRARR